MDLRGKMILVYGGTRGWIGQKFVAYFNRLSGTTAVASTVDIAERADVAAELDGVKPDIVINAAGLTGKRNIDDLEDKVWHEKAFRGNTLGPITIALECRKRSIYFVDLSTGCCYNGRSSHPNGRFIETDPPDAELMTYQYISTKMDGEAGALALNHDMLVLRIRMPIAEDLLHPRCIISKLVANAQRGIIDVENSTTIIKDLVWATGQLIRAEAKGIYHITNPDRIFHRDLVEMYRAYIDRSFTCKLIAIPTGQDPSKILQEKGLTVAGRSTCLLDTTKLENAGIYLAPAYPQIDSYFKNLRFCNPS